MLNLSDIDLVVLFVSADPLDPDNSFLKIDRRYETIIVPLDIEDDPVGSHDTGRCVQTFHLRGTRPSGLTHFIEPGIKCNQVRLSVQPGLYNPHEIEEIHAMFVGQ